MRYFSSSCSLLTAVLVSESVVSINFVEVELSASFMIASVCDAQSECLVDIYSG